MNQSPTRHRSRPAISSTYTRIYAVVRRVPAGTVATYGQIARLARLANGARQVGYALNALPNGTTVPWHRVINARGTISRRAHPGSELTQRLLLQSEGVRFGAGGQVDLAEFGWNTSSRQHK